MKHFLSVMILIAALIVGGCDSSSSSISSDNGDIRVEGENINESLGTAELDIDGGVLVGEAKIKSGRVEVQVGNKTYTFDNSGEISVDVPPGNREVNFRGLNNFTGELTLKAVPKV